ncbi:hypothetical protein GCM10007938_15440 [Vibrio zhanjiangensis]|uniref:DUF2645 family protein n=1 Tax=Vibrio zhanjiangensis TaxID=1046128 RepID=A0ABQ6EXH0_9VIBR|nr:hypothetical protein [Vibrio zhanjiangensis]GLT17766.1 hypothetical protein GCM10007938_15440 [Vibrio zhanjiangensis]
MVHRYTLLFIPLIWFLYLWLTIAFGFELHINGLFYDSFPHPEDPPSIGLLPSSLIPFLMFIGTPIMFFIGSIYTVCKKLWWWFAAYMILGFGFWVYLRI